MRAFFTVVSCALLLAFAGQGNAQDSPRSPAPPSEIGGRKFDQWVKDLKHPDPSVREAAVRAIPGFGTNARDAVSDLADRIGKEYDTSVRVALAQSLSIIEMREADAPAVMKALGKRATDDSQVVVRYYATRALGRFGHLAAKEYLTSLINASKDRGSWEIRQASVWSLARVGYDPGPNGGADPRAVAAIIGAISNEDSSRVRVEAVCSLIVMGKPTNPAIKSSVELALGKALRDSDKHVVIWANVAMILLHDNSEKNLIGIAGFLRTPHPTIVRLDAARALAMLNKKARTRIPDLVDALQDKDTAVVLMSITALVAMGDPGNEALNALTLLSEGKNVDEDVKYAASEALKAIKNGPPKKTP
jgi:HEAT repeat protein